MAGAFASMNRKPRLSVFFWRENLNRGIYVRQPTTPNLDLLFEVLNVAAYLATLGDRAERTWVSIMPPRLRKLLKIPCGICGVIPERLL
jgi:hypothetical protein